MVSKTTVLISASVVAVVVAAGGYAYRKYYSNTDLQISVVLTTSYCSKYFEDMATRATLAIMCLNRKCVQNHLEQSLDEWTRQGSHKQIFRIDTFSELNELHKQVVSEGYNQVLLEDGCGLPSVMAVGPTSCKKIRKLTADLEMVADTFDK
ncbi:hypothetical protein M8J76_004333 [Diaphorina citri]|nr:hypothetical protein M8J76_004333 [Diaphorina citri]